MAENDLVLKQRNELGFDLQVKLIDGRELQVTTNGKKKKDSYSIDILSLQDKSKKKLTIAWKWLVSGICFFLFMLVILKIMPSFLGENKNLYLGIILFAGIVGSMLCLVLFWKYTSLKQIFFSRNANVPLVILKAGKPSKKQFNTFVSAIEKRIAKFRAHMDVDEEKQLTGEIKMLRRLSDEGIVSKADYEKAKTKLLRGFQ